MDLSGLGTRGRLQDLGDGLPAHPGDHHRVRLLRPDPGEPVAEAEGHAVSTAVLRRRLPRPAQGAFPQVRRDGGGDLSLHQQTGGQIGVVCPHIRQPGPLRDQVRRQTQAGTQLDPSCHHSVLLPGDAAPRNNRPGRRDPSRPVRFRSVVLYSPSAIITADSGQQLVHVNAMDHAGLLHRLAPGRRAAQAVHPDVHKQRGGLGGNVQNITMMVSLVMVMSGFLQLVIRMRIVYPNLRYFATNFSLFSFQ